MKARSFLYVFWSLVFIMLALCPGPAISSYKAKIAVFNFTILNLDARGYDATVTNMLISSLGSDSTINILNRKELEAFLSLNDLQQNDDLSNVVNIGNRLCLDMIIVGSVKKTGPVIEIVCKVARIAGKSFIYEKRLKSFGDSGLREEIRRLSLEVSRVIDLNTGKAELPSSDKAVLEAPVNIVSRPGSSKITLQWEDGVGSKPAGYKVFRSQSGEGPFAKIAQVNQCEYVDMRLEKSAAYYYRIKAFDTQGRESCFSQTIHAETAITPNPPIILSTEGHLKGIKITWSPSPIENADPIKLVGYKLYRAKTEEGPYREVANLLGKDLGLGIDTTLDKLFKINYLDKNLADGEEYYYKVSAYNEKSLESDVSRSMVGKCIPVVKGLVAEGDMIRQIKLSWKPATSEHVKGYFIYRSTSGEEGFIKIKKIGFPEINTFLDVKGLKDETDYHYRVSLFEDDEKEGSMSDVASARTKGPPPIPEGLAAKSGIAKKVRLTWNVSPDEDVKGYRLYRSTGGEGEYVRIGGMSNRDKNEYLDKGTYDEPLADNTTYYYKLTSYNKVDVESRPSEIVSATTKPRPVRPSGFGGEGLHVKEIPLFWQPDPEKETIRYHIFRVAGAEEEFSEIACIEAMNSYVDKGLMDGQEYRYKIKAEDEDGLLSDFSDSITLRTKPRPRAPEGLDAVLKGGNVILTWSANTEPDIVSYGVYQKRFFGLTRIATVKEPRFMRVAPDPGKSEDYVIKAVDRDGLESGPSHPITVFGR